MPDAVVLYAGHRVAVKILENVADNIEEIEEEYLVLRDLSLHPNIPAFYGLYLRRGPTQEEDQLWFTMENRTDMKINSSVWVDVSDLIARVTWVAAAGVKGLYTHGSINIHEVVWTWHVH
ncbi:hypothetical protein ANN_00427 [Periplaneta americana]|uniref:Protein kinase domain-containing protein n=1 Tax=Periplaneta americana TaxID=6978 RepID=A0ABQ8TRX3_PERAM|nr:hypothetical protein ANN_00427 [Periplaneta americana]